MSCKKHWLVLFASYLFALANGGLIGDFPVIQRLSFNAQSSQQANIDKFEKWEPNKHMIKRYSYQWTIDDFSLCKEKFIFSPTFPEATPADQLKWSMGLYPDRPNEQYQDNMSIYVWLIKPKLDGGKILATYKLSILDQDGNHTNLKVSERPMEFHSNEGLGFDSYISRDVLLDASRGLLPGDKLTICCEIDALIKSNEVPSAQMEPQSLAQSDELANHLERLYESQDFSDLIISIDDKDFKVHKLILTVCSPVFKTMLNGESGVDILKLDDIQPATFQEVLRFIYTGKVSLQEEEEEAPTTERRKGRLQLAIELFKASDKYKLDGLRSICERVLTRAISEDSAGHLLIVANSHKAPELKNKVIEFIRENYRQLFQTHNWISSFKEAPTELIAELNRKIFM